MFWGKYLFCLYIALCYPKRQNWFVRSKCEVIAACCTTKCGFDGIIRCGYRTWWVGMFVREIVGNSTFLLALQIRYDGVTIRRIQTTSGSSSLKHTFQMILWFREHVLMMFCVVSWPWVHCTKPFKGCLGISHRPCCKLARCASSRIAFATSDIPKSNDSCCEMWTDHNIHCVLRLRCSVIVDCGFRPSCSMLTGHTMLQNDWIDIPVLGTNRRSELTQSIVH